MHIGSSRNTLLKMTSEIAARRGNGGRVSFADLENEVFRYQDAGVAIYGSRGAEEIRRRISDDLRRLERLHLLSSEGDGARLTGAGHLVALNLEYPSWVEERLGRNASAGAP